MLDATLVASLRDMQPFLDLNDKEMEQVAAAATLVNLAKGEQLTVGGDEDALFYLVVEGWLTLEDLKGEAENKVGSLRAGDFFGADFLLYATLRRTRVTAGEATQLLVLEPGDLANFIRSMPKLKAGLLASRDTTIRLRSKFFDWVSEGEQVKVVLRQHPMFLIEAMLVPFVWFLGGLLVTFTGRQMAVASLRIAFTSIGVAVLVLGFLWLVWSYFDWRNDYYIITSQRVIWLEQVIGLYESRREAVLNAIKSTDIKTSWLGRTFGYGDLTVFALMGEVRFAHIPNPDQVKALIEHLQKRFSLRIQREDTQAMERIIRRKIDPPPPAPPKPFEPAKPAETKKAAQPVFDLKEFFNMETRYVKGSTITYRKHHFILLTRTGVPLTGLLVIIAATGYFVYRNLAGISHFPSLYTSLLTGIFLGSGFLFWLWYQYVDWHNDIYQITPDKIIDSERKPLGSEITKSAPLGNIQNMDYERIGILGLLLNYGNVKINTGSENIMVWFKIHDPARAQMDIFNNLYQMRQKQQLSESTRQWEQVSDWMAAYHRQAEDLRKSQGK